MKNNPYVGPRPYSREDSEYFFGRNREARDLVNLMMAERVVLFYAQSGAGKSSLLNARVLPALEDEGFQILPIARVGNEVPPGLALDDVNNIFIFSTLMSLAEARPAESLLEHTLLSFLHTLFPESEDGGDVLPVLIWDQFEELFTAHRSRWQDARGFFEQVREALEEFPTLGVAFVMREDYVAEMEPYAPLMPRRLRARFRMERLRYKGALEAVRQPALHAGCPFDKGAAEHLVDDLRRLRMGQGGEEGDAAPLGPYVEPVQLQVVCSRLWENLPEQEDRLIQWEEVQEFGDIDQALTDFYEQALARCARETGVKERQLRRWFGAQLITPMQTRGLVMRGKQDTGGLPNVAVDVLESEHIIRAEARAGAHWYELSHDRFVMPVLRSNEVWEASRETPLRATARRWQETDDASLLYHDEALAEALAWADTHPDDIEAYETAFLEASEQAARARAQVQRRRRVLAAAAAVAGVIMTVLAVLAIWQWQVADSATQIAIDAAEQARQEALISARAKSTADAALAVAEVRQEEAEAAQAETEIQKAEAERQRDLAQRQTRIARAGQLATYSQVLEGSQQLRALLAVEALYVTLDEGEQQVPAAEQALRSALMDIGGRPLPAEVGRISQLAFSADGERLIVGGHEGVKVWTLATSADPVILSEEDETRSEFALSPSGRWLALSGKAGKVRLWDLTQAESGDEPELLAGAQGEIHAVAFSPDGGKLAAGGKDKTIWVWDTSDLSADPMILRGHEEAVTRIIFASQGGWMATAEMGNVVRVWNLTLPDPAAARSSEVHHEALVLVMAFSPDGEQLATSTEDGTLSVWATRGLRSEFVFKSPQPANVVTFDAEGSRLFWIGQSGAVQWLDLTVPNPGRAPPTQLGQHMGGGAVLDLDPQGRWLATGGEDAVVRVWDLTAEHPRDSGMVLQGHEGPVDAIAFSPDGQQVVTGGADGIARVWNLSRPDPAVLPIVLQDASASPAFDPKGHWLVTGGREGARVWDLTASLPFASSVLLTGVVSEGVAEIQFSPAGRWLAVLDDVGEAQVWDLAVSDFTTVLTPPSEIEGPSETLRFSPDGRWLALGHADGLVQLWDLEGTAGGTLTLRGLSAPAEELRFSLDGLWLIARSADGAVQMWDLVALVPVEVPFEPSTAVAWGPKGQWLAMAPQEDGKGLVQLWDAATPGAESAPLVLEADQGTVTALAFSPSAQYLAAGVLNGSMWLWDLTLPDPQASPVILRGYEGEQDVTLAFSHDGQWMATGGCGRIRPPSECELGAARLGNMDSLSEGTVLLDGYEGLLTNIAFSPDGQWFTLWGESEVAWVWPMPMDVLIQSACDVVGRNMTRTEWDTYFPGQPYQTTCEEWGEYEVE